MAWGCLTPCPGLTLLVSKQSGALPFAEGRHTAGDWPREQTSSCQCAQPMVHTSMRASQPPGPQQWGTRPLGRERWFTQQDSHNLAGDPQKAFKCLFFKVVSKAGEKLSESHNEEFNGESAKGWKEAEEKTVKEEALGFGERNAKEGNTVKNNSHITETVQPDICETLFSYTCCFFRHMLSTLTEKPYSSAHLTISTCSYPQLNVHLL